MKKLIKNFMNSNIAQRILSAFLFVYNVFTAIYLVILVFINKFYTPAFWKKKKSFRKVRHA